MSSNLWRSVVQVSGVATEVLGIRATGPHALLQVLIIPGNPGSARFYEMQLVMLHAALGGTADVLSVSHAGHEPDALAGATLWSLDEQIKHKADFIRQYCLVPGKPPLAIAAHSIGAYMAVKAVALAELDHEYLEGGSTLPPILKVIAMFPFFWIDRSQWKIFFLRMAASRYEVMGRLAQMLSLLLPRWLIRTIIKHVTRGTMGDSAVEATRQLLTRSSVRNFFYLAHTEFRDLDEPPPWHLLQNLGPRLHVLGCPEDVWMSSRQFSEMHAQVSGLQSTWMEDVRHAYCASNDQCQLVTDVVAEICQSKQQHDVLPASRL